MVSPILTALGAAAVIVSLLRYLKVLYSDGKLHYEDRMAARSAMLLPVILLTALVALIVVIVDQVPPLMAYLPLAIGTSAVIAMVWALERARRAVLKRQRG